MRVKGSDGDSVDWYKFHLGRSHIMAAPQAGLAFGNCGNCGTKTPITGRPGTEVNRWKCRCCQHNVRVSNSFKFLSLN